MATDGSGRQLQPQSNVRRQQTASRYDRSTGSAIFKYKEKTQWIKNKFKTSRRGGGVKIISIDEPEIDSSYYSHEKHQRSEGCHVTRVIADLEREISGQDKFRDFDEQRLEVYRAVGFLFERALYDVILQGEAVERPGEVKRDGIILSPDAVRLENWRLIESKATWRGMGPVNGEDIFGHKFWGWWRQMMAYAHAIGTQEAELWAMFMNGDYREHRGPHLKRVIVEFTKKERQQNWDMIRRRAEQRKWI